MRVQINESESWEINFPETATVEEARTLGRFLIDRIDTLTSSREIRKIEMHEKKNKNGRKPKLFKKNGRGMIKSREHAIEMFKIYYNPRLSRNEKAVEMIKHGVKYQIFQNSTTTLRKRWAISELDIKVIQESMKQKTAPQIEEVKKNEESLTSSVTKKEESKDFADEFEKW